MRDTSEKFIEDAVNRYSDTVFRIAFQYVYDRSDAEDILQEVTALGAAERDAVCWALAEQWCAAHGAEESILEAVKLQGCTKAVQETAQRMETARAVGIRTVTPTLKMLMGEPVLLRTRADRDEANRPYAALSAKSLIAPKGTGLRKTITYSDIVDFLTQEGAAPKEDLPEVWRRMAFTLLTGPTGDHPERWLFIRPVGRHSDGWRLAPAHSLTFTSPSLFPRGGMKLRAGSSRFTTDEAVTYAPYFDLTIQEAKRFVLTVRRRLLDWDADAREYGIPPREIEAMADAFED